MSIDQKPALEMRLPSLTRNGKSLGPVRTGPPKERLRSPLKPRPSKALKETLMEIHEAPKGIGGFEDQPVYENQEPTELTMPVLQISKLVPEEGRGITNYEGDADPVYGGYIAKLPLDELKFALARESTPKAMAFLMAIADPAQSHVKITTLAKRCGIGLTEIMQIWRSNKLVKAMGVYIDATPTIAEHTVKDAESYNVCCPRCDGGGLMKVERNDIWEWLECVNCQGTGAVRKIGDTRSREQILQATGILQSSRGGVNITTQIHQHHSVESIIDELDDAIDIKAAEDDA